MNYTKELNAFKDYLDNRVQPGTASVYIYALRRWIDSLNGIPLSSKAAQHYIDSLARSGKSPSTVTLRAHAIMRFFKWRGEIIHLDCPTIRIGEPKYLTMKEFEKVLSKCTTLLEKVVVTVLFDTAVRISELLNLELSDIDKEQMTISVVRKGGRRQEVNISEKAFTVLDRWIEERNSESKRVFMDLDYWTIWDMVRRLGKRAKVKLTPHTLRHTRAIQMLMSGADMHTVQNHLGHTNIATTINIYGRFRAAELKERIPSW